ncbi:MAG: bifunctional oligoribonuclease/PAP phosphatase NrnA [Bacteroidales bacterium]|nr:bifunctional oligoribonuclease/PAP phosphatase NrnA [Bacteroidales bacterium]
MIDSEFVNSINKILSDSRRIVITTHTNPDGDAIGSSLSLLFMLQKLGHSVELVVANSFPSFLSWLPEANRIIIHESNPAEAKSCIENAEVIFCLDFNAIQRSGSIHGFLKQSKAIFVLIDHHREPELESFDLHFCDINISSTSELIYQFFQGLNVENLIDKNMATCLFTGIMTDTGSFSHGIGNSSTFIAIARLIDAGLDAADVHSKVYNSMTENRLRLMGFSINDKLQIIEKYQTAIIALDKQDLLNFDYQIGDTEGIVNLPLSIDSIRLSILITERKDYIHLSLRSKGSISVNDMARKYLNGGGHLNAAGGKTYTSLQQTIDYILNFLPEFEKEILIEG